MLSGVFFVLVSHDSSVNLLIEQIGQSLRSPRHPIWVCLSLAVRASGAIFSGGVHLGADISEGEAGGIELEDSLNQLSKTGGARCVTIHPPLARILRHIQKADLVRICPPNWHRLWAGLHKAAGFTHWQPDVLRHTFATHHLATFRSYAELQLEMGHRSAELLRPRYVAMEGLLRYRRGESILVG